MKTSLEIKSTVYSQIYLGFYSEYLPVTSGALDSSVCKLCSKVVHGQNHWILHCKTLFDALDYFQPLISELEQVDEKNKFSECRRKVIERCYEILSSLAFDFPYIRAEGKLFIIQTVRKRRS